MKASGSADITVASVASIRSADRLSKYDPCRFKLILVDEAHHIVAPSYLEVLKHFGLVKSDEKGDENTHTALVGVSATFSRADGLSLGAAIDHIVYHRDYVDMIDEGWLANAVFTTVQSGADLSKVESPRGDFQTGSLSRAVNNQQSNDITVRAWLAKAGARKSTLVFCVDLCHVADLTAMFRHHNVDARSVTGDTSVNVRKEKLDGFKAGDFPVLVNCGIYTEGTDIPNVDCVLLARPTKSRNLLVQMIGRGLRKHPGKEDCHVIDMVASLETGIVTVPTLFGLNPWEVVDQADGKTLKALKEREESERREQAASSVSKPDDGLQALTGDVTFIDYADVNELIEDTSGERHIRAISPHAWVQVRENCYILSSGSKTGEYLQVDEADKQWKVWFYQKLQGTQGSSLHLRPRLVASVSTLEHGMKAADTYAKQKFMFALISKSARWRYQPASEGQITFLNKRRDKDKQLSVGQVKKGTAGDWITKLVHGAARKYKEIASAKRKADKLQDEKSSQRNAQVRVGPVAKL
ncbi:hypothetical protein LTR08_004982 [Meristemomyces frigidus]|nr:hypothetical protein LTR08_004982 [Meristemomyces frigidus]